MPESAFPWLAVIFDRHALANPFVFKHINHVSLFRFSQVTVLTAISRSFKQKKPHERFYLPCLCGNGAQSTGLERPIAVGVPKAKGDGENK